MNVNIYEELKKKTIINILYYIIIFVFIQLHTQKQNGNVVVSQMISKYTKQ